MTKQVLIENGRVKEVIAKDTEFPEGVITIDAPDDVAAGYGYKDGKFIRPSIYNTLPGDEIHALVSNENYVNAQLAKQELALSDRVCVRFVADDAAPLPQEWKDYRTQLRAIIALEFDTEATSIPLPPRPSIPWTDSPLFP